MTTLIAWAGVDQRGPASLYLASDSRISWGGPHITWDRGRKLFAARNRPHLLGYCGDAFFPTQVLSQVIDMIDAQLLCPDGQSPTDCIDSIVRVIGESLKKYGAAPKPDFSIIHVMRIGLAMRSQFVAHRVIFSQGNPGRPHPIKIPQNSDVLTALGSGESAFNNSMSQWRDSDVQATSRAVFSAFCDALRAGSDPLSGPPPQLVGLYRVGGGRAFGVVWEGNRYFYGTEVEEAVTYKNIQWHNDLFEVSDPATLDRETDRQPQPRPRKLEPKIS